MSRASLDPDLDRLLEAERSASAPSEALDRVWSRLATTSLAAGGAGAAGKASVAAKGGSGALVKLGAWGASKTVVLGAALIMGGALVTATAMHGVKVSPSPAPSPTHAAAPPIAGPVASPPASAAPTALPVVTPDELPAARKPPTATATSPELPRERVVLDAARAALADGDAARALSLLDDHARRFAKPQLSEEREALAVQALVAVGRYDDARARAARFRAASPASLFLPAIDATIASIP